MKSFVVTSLTLYDDLSDNVYLRSLSFLQSFMLTLTVFKTK